MKKQFKYHVGQKLELAKDVFGFKKGRKVTIYELNNWDSGKRSPVCGDWGNYLIRINGRNYEVTERDLTERKG